ncbi:hypothetical protein CMO83_04770 [Candidatus Woesearchaeota archaeon]|jgi:putative hemolysin|nr:hypothetical protein [Candidatus Woesearchaeota archaeon]MDP6648221.1 hemolysin family protein [Candidatus Woesearchaeota archaeon]|tara:strand:- start:22507 stop:23742 length:1236 start_codon:yes stop_codon:yes gene_type:complete
MPLETQIIIIIVLLVLSAFFAGSEAALLSLSRFRVRYMVEKKRFGAIYIKKLKDNPETLLSTILIGNNVVNVAAAAMATSIAITILQNNAVGIATGVMTFLLLIFGEITPKTLATRNNEAFSLFAARIIWYMSIVLYPVIKLLDFFLKALNKLIGSKKTHILSEEELKTIVKTSEEEGSIKEIEKKMIEKIFDFDNTTVGDVMTDKKRMVLVNSELAIKDVLKLPMAKMYSRLPVYTKRRENIVGILNLKDTLKYLKSKKLDVKVGDIMREPFFVFKNKKIDSMLHMFQKRKEHMAIVADEKGFIVGLVTIENILEEIVGEIIDESDRINPNVFQIEKNQWVVKGITEIDELNKKTGIPIKAKDYDNLDSFILKSLKRAPQVGEEISHDNFKVVMEDVQGRKVLKARIVKE